MLFVPTRLDDASGRVTRVTHSSVVVASYDYLGSGQVVKTYLDAADVYSSVTGASGHGYGDLDRFGRLTGSSWTWDPSNIDLYRTTVSYDRNSWITRVQDNTWSRQSVDYTNDELGRLVEADRGYLSGGAITLSNFNHEWTLGQTGNWNRSKLDLNGDADFADTDELDENNPLASGGSEHFNKANELTARDTDNNGSDNYTLAYDEVGNMIDDGKEYEYVYDAFGRLRKIKNTSNQALVSEYWYNGLGHRITWHADTTRAGGGAPDGSVNTDDPKVHFVYNERWQQVAAYRQANGSGVDTYPKEQFVHHNAGHGGYGGGSYIDSVILRDDHEDDWTESADSSLERRVYYCQNWRADVVALLAENGRIVERAWYEPYGTPHGMSPADFGGTSDDTNDHYLVPDGDADADDSFVYLDLFGISAALSDMTGSSDPGDGEYGRPNGTVDSDDYFYYLDQFSVAVNLGRNVLSAGHDGATASHGAGNLRNRRGLAGYEWDPHVRRYHVRNRVLYPEIGRWTRRDPMGYVDGAMLLRYAAGGPVNTQDPFGLNVKGPNSPGPNAYNTILNPYLGSEHVETFEILPSLRFRTQDDTIYFGPRSRWTTIVDFGEMLDLAADRLLHPDANGMFVLSIHVDPLRGPYYEDEGVKVYLEEYLTTDEQRRRLSIARGMIVHGCYSTLPEEAYQRIADNLGIDIYVTGWTNWWLWGLPDGESWRFTGGTVRVYRSRNKWRFPTITFPPFPSDGLFRIVPDRPLTPQRRQPHDADGGCTTYGYDGPCVI